MLGGGDPVGVDRLDVVGVGLAAPADQEALGDRRAPRRPSAAGPAAAPVPRADWATKVSAITEARARSSRACSSAMSISGCKPHSGAEHRQRSLDVDARVAASGRSAACGSAGGRPGSKRAVDEQAPDLLERHRADEVLDVDAAVAQRAALLVGLGDLGGEGDDALEARTGLSERSGGRWRPWLMRSAQSSQITRASACPDADAATDLLFRPVDRARRAWSAPARSRARELVAGVARSHRGAQPEAQRVRRRLRRGGARRGRRRSAPTTRGRSPACRSRSRTTARSRASG